MFDTSSSLPPPSPNSPTSGLHWAKWLWTGPGRLIENGFMLVEGNRIQSVGRFQDLSQAQQQGLQEEHGAQPPSHMLIPGFINAHAHLELSFPTGIPLSPTDTMGDWLLNVVTQNRAEGVSEGLSERVRRGVQQMKEAGITTINDISSTGESLAILDDEGLRGIVSLEFFHPGQTVDPENPFLTALIQRYKALSTRYKGHPRLQVGLSPHSPYNVSPQAWQHVIQTCQQTGQPPFVHTHLAESLDEMDWLSGTATEENGIHRLHQHILGKTFPSAFASQMASGGVIHAMAEWGLFSHPMLMAHGVYLNEADLSGLAQQQRHISLGLAHCPQSNLWLQKTSLTPQQYEQCPLPIGIGTDSQLSSHTLDIRADAELAQKRLGLTAEGVLSHLTQQGAQALNQGNTLGQLLPGYQADFTAWNLPEHLTPETMTFEQALTHVLTPGIAPQQMWVNGQRLSNTHQVTASLSK